MDADLLFWFLPVVALMMSLRPRAGGAGAAALLAGAGAFAGAAFFGAGDCFLDADLAGLVAFFGFGDW